MKEGISPDFSEKWERKKILAESRTKQLVIVTLMVREVMMTKEMEATMMMICVA